MRRHVLTAAIFAALSLTGLAPATSAVATPATPARGAAAAATAAQAAGGQDPGRPPTSYLHSARAALTGRSGVSPSLALADLFAAYPKLSPLDKAAADRLLARPTNNSGGDPVKYEDGTTVRRTCSTDVCVQYVTTTDDAPPPADDDGDGTPDWVETNRFQMQQVWDYEVDTLGYRPPAPDGVRGGNAKLDVYLANIGGLGYYGYCTTETRVPNQAWRASGYCVLDDDFAEFPLGPLPSMRVTGAHEFFHAIQFNYDFGEDGWLMEATATWMEERFADDVNDSRGYLEFGQLRRPTVPLDTFSGLTHYGNWIFFERLSQRYGVGSVKALWARLDASRGKPDEYSTQAIKSYLSGRKTTFPAFYAGFAAGNVVPAQTYSEGSDPAYTTAPVVARYTLQEGSPTRAGGKTLAHLSNRNWQFFPGSTLTGTWGLQLRVDGPNRSTGPAAHVLVHLDSGLLVRRLIRLNAAGNGSTRVVFSPAGVDHVTLTLANASTRFACWRGTIYSCSGRPLDNGRAYRFQVTAVR